MTLSFGSVGEHKGDVVGRKGSSEQVRPYQPVCWVTGKQVGRRVGKQAPWRGLSGLSRASESTALVTEGEGCVGGAMHKRTDVATDL